MQLKIKGISKPAWLDKVMGGNHSPYLSSRSYRYLSRQIESDYPYHEKAKSIVLTTTDSLSLCSDTILMFGYCMQEELGCKVLIVDATFTENGLSDRLGYAEMPGFMNFLYGSDVPLVDLLKPSVRDGLFILPAGNTPKDTGRLSLTLKNIEDFITLVSNDFDYILFQQGSVLEDTRYLLPVRLSDLVLLLIDEGSTLVDNVALCQQLFDDYNLNNVRLLLSSA